MSFSEWNFKNYHVMSETEALAGNYINAESTLIAAGPPSLKQLAPAQVGGDILYPIGLLENLGLTQSKQLQRIFEIGSSRSYFVGGRVVGSVTLGRIMYDGPSLLNVLYAYYRQDKGDVNVHNNSADPVNKPLLPGIPLAFIEAKYPKIQQAPGKDNIWMNLGSDLFNQPLGLGIYFRDNNNEDVSAGYLEFAHIQGHQLSISSGSVLLMEGVSMQYDRYVPIKIKLKAATA